MRKPGARVYMEFLNGDGDVIDRVLIAEFNHENWANAFIEDQAKWMFSDERLVKEVVSK